MLNSVLLCCLLVFVGAYLIQYLADTGLFRKIEPYGLDRCHLVVPEGGETQAFEDLAIDYEKGVAYLPGDDRRWWFSFNQSIDGIEKHGHIYLLNIQEEKFHRFQLVDYQYEHFHPIGIGLLKGKENRLFMTNHRKENGAIVGTVEIFQDDSTSNENQLKFIDSVVHPLFTTPDDVLPIDENTFFVTNVYHYRKDYSSFLHTFEIATRRPWTNLLLCSKKSQWDCSTVVDRIAMANGLAASLDLKTIYMAASTEKRIYVFQHDLQSHALTFRRFLSTPFITDNIFVNDRDELIAAGHPYAISFLQHEKNPREHRAHSEVVLFSRPKSNSTYKNVFLSNGEILSASTVGASFNGKLLIGALFDSGILFCDDLL